MFKNLSPQALGVMARQSELIEMALTYRFRSLDVDIHGLHKQAATRGLEHAERLIKSAKIQIGPFELKTRWQGSEDQFKEDMEQLNQILDTAITIGAKTCYTTVMPACDTRPYHENFEFHRERLTKLAEVLAAKEFRLGLDFLAPAHHREDRQYQFISTPDALLTLIKTIVANNIGIMIDTWHWHVGGGTVGQIREIAPDQITMVRLADIPDGVALDSIQDDQRSLPSESGIVDNLGVLSALHENGYEGPVSSYPHPSALEGIARDKVIPTVSDALDELIKKARKAASEEGEADVEASGVSVVSSS